MIYLHDDYIEKYQNTFSYLVGRAIEEKYNFNYIENTIALSKMCFELEHSNVTTIAFSSEEKIYSDLFPLKDNVIDVDMFGPYGWLGIIYINLFLELKTTFQFLFYVLPIEEALNLYVLYHEMDYSQVLDYVKKKIKYSHLDVVMSKQKMSSVKLSELSGVSSATINAIRYQKRDFDKLEAKKASQIAASLNVKIESLISKIPLVFDKRYG